VPTLRPAAPSGPEWLHEIKYDGYRVQMHVTGGNARIFTRNGYDWTERFSSIARAAAALAVREVVLDGEAVVLDEHRMPDMARLRSSISAGRGERFVCFAFDLLYLDGFDLRPAQLTARKQLLAALLIGSPNALRFSEHLEGDGPDILAQVCSMGLEGIVSKQREAPYRSGRTETWIKAKCKLRRTFPIVAFVEKLGASPRKVASLYVGRWDGERLLYAGKVGTGYTEMIARDLRERLDPYIRKESPLSLPVVKPKATWVEPVLEAEVDFTTETADGLLREAVFKGVR
jgi:bifunctional non-homologous end joining protein LigD